MCEDEHGIESFDGIGRRALFVTGAAAALTLGSVTFASGSDATDRTETRTVSGTLPTGSPDFVYLPVEIPRGVREIHVAYTYEKPSVPAGTAGNALDIGLFDERGTALGGEGFRGWSGGARTEFFVRADDATPGYIPGRIRPGTWHIALGPYTVAPQGLPYEVTITLTYGEQDAARSRRTRRPVRRAGAAPGTGVTAISTPGIRTAAAPPRRSPRWRAPRVWTSSTARTTTRTARTPTGRTRQAPIPTANC